VAGSTEWLTRFDVQWPIEEAPFPIEAPVGCSLSDVMRKASEAAGKKGVNLEFRRRLVCEHSFADHFELKAIYAIKLVTDFPEGIRLSPSSRKVERFGIDPPSARMLVPW
jgi:hypothetical protein